MYLSCEDAAFAQSRRGGVRILHASCNVRLRHGVPIRVSHLLLQIKLIQIQRKKLYEIRSGSGFIAFMQ